jgi:prepilin-type N-terminal cleavage/methylation domain-containing protein
MSKNKKYKHELGFTLVELMVVLSTIAVLLMIAAIAYRAQISKGYDARRKTDIHQIKIALEEYEKDNDCYPPALDSSLDPYIPYIPTDPAPPYVPYTYFSEPDSCPSWFWMFTNLGYEDDPIIEELGCQDGCGPLEEYLIFDYYQASTNAPDPFGVIYSDGSSGDAPPADWSYYGCFSGTCGPVGFDPDRPLYGGAACDPNYTTSDCSGKCVDELGEPINECTYWGN